MRGAINVAIYVAIAFAFAKAVANPSGVRSRSLAVLLLLHGLMAVAHAGIPAPYQAMVVEPQISTTQPATWEFDLSPALQRASKEGRWLYVYLGATDCPYCRKYEAFLAEHAQELLPHFREKYIVVDLRSELSVQAKQLVLHTDTLRLPYAEFQKAIGDQRARLLVYPSVWLLDANAKPLMQMPAGTGTFQTVPEQLEILQLVE